MSQLTLDSYTWSSIYTVAGYLRSIDAQAIKALLEYQAAANITGNLCEIGVHHGRLFLMLALARRSGERAVAIDLFEDDPGNAADGSHRGRNRALVRNAERLEVPLDAAEVFKTSSLDISIEDVLAHTGGPVRFFSIDGGHDYRCVANDLPLATGTLRPDGIIAVDDFFNREWPEVAFATYDYLRQQQSLVPFLLTTGKLYLARQEFAERYEREIVRRLPAAKHSTVEMLGRNVAYLRDSNVKRVFDVLKDRVMERVRVRRS